MTNSLRGQRFGILGMGRSGIGAARLINRLGGTALISDQKPEALLVEAIAALRPTGVEVEAGGHRRIIEENFDAIVVSPGAVLHQTWIERWESRGVALWSELELAARCSKVPWIGVTGSNGKTTTVTLLTSMLEHAGFRVNAAGNIGIAWSELLPADELDVFVVEVSSFQMEHAPSVHPRICVLLNVLENHLDRHGDLTTYGALKLKLAANQNSTDTTVLNADDRFLVARAAQLPGKVEYFGKHVLHGWGIEQGELVFQTPAERKTILSGDEWSLIGEHNLLNAAAAGCAAACFGADLTAIRSALLKAQPVEHRIEFVRELDGVMYINDSKSTNLSATLTALNAVQGEVILLFGGRAKKESFVPLRELLGHKIIAMFVYGEARSKVAEELGNDRHVHYAETLAQALANSRGFANRGMCVLLSPGCASYDQFSNFEERGHQFKQLVNAL